MRSTALHACFIFIFLSIFDQLDTYAVEIKTATVTSHGENGTPILGSRRQYVYITCLDAFKPIIYPNNAKFQGMYIYKCQIPKTPLGQQLENAQIDISDLQILQFTDTLMETPLPADFTAGLPVTTLELWNLKNFQPYPIFFTLLAKLRELSFGKMEVPTLPPSNLLHLERLILKYSPVKSWDNCEHIQKLEVEGLTKEQIPKEWPVSCSQLKTLKLELMTLEATHNVMESMKEDSLLKLERLTIRNCSLAQLPLKLMKSKNLNSIDFSNNDFLEKAMLQFPLMDNLAVLELSNNEKIHAGDLIEMLSKAPALYELKLDGMYGVHLDSNLREALTKHKPLLRLSLNNMQLKPDCLKHTHFSWLSNLGLASDTSEYIEILQLQHLPSTGISLEVDLRGHSARTVVLGSNFTEHFENLTQSEHWLTNKGYKLVVLLDFVDCDCNNDILRLALTQFPDHLSMPGLKCNSKNGNLFLEEPMENLSCRKATVNGCKRKLSRDRNYTTVVDCSYIKDNFRWPRPHRLFGLNATGNNIATLHNAYLPESLEWLDLRYNKISDLSADDVTKLFGSNKRRLWLAGNPLVCDCENRQMVEALQNNPVQIVDYEKLECFENRTISLVKDVSILELCKSEYTLDLPDFGLPKLLEGKISCSGPLEKEKHFPTRTTFDTLTLDRCTLSMIRLKDVLESLNIDVDNLQTLRLNDVVMPQNVEKHYSAGLAIRNVELVNIMNFPSNFFAYLGALQRLTIENMFVPPLPPYNKLPLIEMTLKNSTMRFWDNCMHLQTLQMIGLDKQQIPLLWPPDCGELKFLLMKNMTPETVKYVIITTNEISLKELSVHNCSLVDSPLRLMRHPDRLEVLDLSHNELEDKEFLQFPDLKNLITLNLAHNKLKGEFLIEAISKIPKLRDLVLDGNNFVHIFQKFEIKSSITTLQFLKRLSLNNMKLDADCLMYSNFSKLEYLGLQANEEQKALLKLYGLPRTGAAQLKVDLSGRSFRSVQIDRDFNEDFDPQNAEKFWITSKRQNFIVTLDYIDCVCNNDVLWGLLRDFSRFLSMPGLRCDSKDGPLFVDEPQEKLNCLKANFHGCKRRISRDFDYITMVDCSYNKEKFRWPRPDKIYRSLNASGNHITSLRNAYLPETLQSLDLRNNHIARLDVNQSALLFNSPARRVWFSGNPIVCQCDNQVLLNSLRTNHSQIMDYDDLTCADSGQLIRLISIDELCRIKLEFVWGTAIVLLILALIAALLLRHYWISLRIYLYARGYCMSCLHEEDIDEDRPFDAFLSFAHGDNQYVLEKLLPKLEGEPNFYRVCVHYRDWPVGEWIPAQIMRSVRLSKRTIIVLSKNFVTSMWGSMEFRHAQASIESEGRSRLLVLVLDDVLSENLAPELRNYLSLNTYLKCDDPWFWEKLRFAMPRTQRSPPQDPPCTEFVNTPHSELLSMDVLQSTNDTSQSAK